MKFTKDTKENIKREIITSLKPEKEVNKIVIFGSFLYSDKPNSDINSFLSEINAGELIYER